MNEKKGLCCILAIVVALCAVGLLLVGCRQPECVQTQGTSHASGPLHVTGAGTVSLPAYTVGKDYDTGWYQSAAGNIDWAVDGANVLNLSSSGADWGGSAFVVDVTGAISMDGDAASHFNTSVGDITIEAETGSVTIKGDEEVADAILLDANNSITQGVDIDVGSVYGLSIDGGLTDFGSGTYATADGDNDVGIEGDLEVNNNCDFDGDVDVDGTLNADDADFDLSASFNIDGHMVDIGTGTYATASGDGDLGVAGDLEVDGNADLDGTLEVASNITAGAAIYLEGNTFYLDADRDSTLAENGDDQIELTLGDASGDFRVLTGNFLVGAGAPGLVPDGNDAFILGTLEVDGDFQPDGGISRAVGDVTVEDNFVVTGTADFQDNVADSVGTLTITDDVLVDGQADAEQLVVQGYITQTSDVFIVEQHDGTDVFLVNNDGNVQIAGTLLADGDITLEYDETISNSENGVITFTVASDGYAVVATGNFKVGNGSPDLALNGEDAYVEGTFEVDSAARFDDGITIGAGDLTISNGLFYWNADDLAVSDGDWITPTTVTAYNLTASGEVTITLGSTCSDGQQLYLAADSAQTYTISYVNIRTTNGAALAFDQYDILGFMCMDSEWLLMFENNLQ